MELSKVKHTDSLMDQRCQRYEKVFDDELPEVWADLIEKVRKTHPESGGENRAAMAEMQARAAWELNRATKGLQKATWILAFSTVVLCLITLLKN